MKRYQVMLLCNDSFGFTTNKLEAVTIADEIALDGPPRSIRFLDDHIKVGRHRYACTNHQPCTGNLFWDAVTLDLDAARALVSRLLASGWSVSERAVRGPFARIAREAQS